MDRRLAGLNDPQLGALTCNKAAKEVVVRIGSRLPIHTRGTYVGPVQELCKRLRVDCHGQPESPATACRAACSPCSTMRCFQASVSV
jgi:hypothetical protein